MTHEMVMLVGAGFKPALPRHTQLREIVVPECTLVRDVMANAIESFLITNDMVVRAMLLQGAALNLTGLHLLREDGFETRPYMLRFR